MTESLKLIKKLKYFIGIIFSIFLLVGLAFSSNALSWVLGMAAGLPVGILMFIQLGRSAEMAMLMPPKSASRYFVLQYVLRTIIYGVTIILTLRVKEVSTLATVAGLSVIKGAILLQNLWNMWKGGRS